MSTATIARPDANGTLPAAVEDLLDSAEGSLTFAEVRTALDEAGVGPAEAKPDEPADSFPIRVRNASSVRRRPRSIIDVAARDKRWATPISDQPRGYCFATGHRAWRRFAAG